MHAMPDSPTIDECHSDLPLEGVLAAMYATRNTPPTLVYRPRSNARATPHPPVYEVLREYDKCISNVNSTYSFDWGGDCAW